MFIDVFSVTDLYYQNNKNIIMNLINNSVVS